MHQEASQRRFHRSTARALGAIFPSTLCAVDGTRAALEGARQATLLTGRDGELAFLSISYRTDRGPTEMVGLSPDRAFTALLEAVKTARSLGVAPSLVVDEGNDVAHLIGTRAREHDLLVIGARVTSRAVGAILGSTVSSVVHHATTPLLVSREPPGRCDFPQRILVASDGSASSHRAVQIAGDIAARHEAAITLIRVSGHRSAGARLRFGEDAAALFERLGAEPIVETAYGHPQQAIVEAARRQQASLIVMGSRGLRGIHSLGSTSERVAHRAPCSVLVVQARAE